MRVSLLFLILISALLSGAQKTLPEGYATTSQKKIFNDTGFSIQKSMNRRWFFTSYNGIGMSFIFFNGGSASVIDAPVGLRLNRRLNNNFYAFAGVSASPAYINFNRAFLSPPVNKLNSVNGLNSNNFGWYSRADLGLTYINDARTFSISGSVGVERSNNPIFFYQSRQVIVSNPFVTPNK